MKTLPEHKAEGRTLLSSRFKADHFRPMRKAVAAKPKTTLSDEDEEEEEEVAPKKEERPVGALDRIKKDGYVHSATRRHDQFQF